MNITIALIVVVALILILVGLGLQRRRAMKQAADDQERSREAWIARQNAANVVLPDTLDGYRGTGLGDDEARRRASIAQMARDRDRFSYPPSDRTGFSYPAAPAPDPVPPAIPQALDDALTGYPESPRPTMVAGGEVEAFAGGGASGDWEPASPPADPPADPPASDTSTGSSSASTDT